MLLIWENASDHTLKRNSTEARLDMVTRIPGMLAVPRVRLDTGGMNPDAVPTGAFETMVADALDSLPDWVERIVSEIAVLVEDEQPKPEQKQGVLLLGLYRGVPRTTHYGRAPGTLPDTITLYRIPIVEVCDRVEDVPGRVRTVLMHEVGHAMGLSEARLRELGVA